jgi:YHS domain-containing protein
MRISPQQAEAKRAHMGRTFYFYSPACAQEFDADPHRYLEMQRQQVAG